MTAIVPYQGNELVRRRGRRGATSVLQYASGGLAADVHVERVDARERCSWYALTLVANESDVTGRLVGLRRGGIVEELGSLAAAAGSVGSARFAVTTPRTGPYVEMFLELRSGEMLLRVEAPRPPAAPSFRGLKTGATLVGLGLAAIVAGTLPFAFARDANHAASARTLAVAPPQPSPTVQAARLQDAPARVQAFSARRDTTTDGRETVLASYLAVGDRGSIALLDGDGIVVTTAPFTRLGTVRLPVPRAYRTLPMTAQITVHRGASKAVSSVAVPAITVAPVPAFAAAPPSAAQPATPEPPAEGVTPIDSASAGGAAGVVAVEGRAVAGHPLRLRITPQGSPVRIELEDETGAAITDTTLAPGATHATLPLPVSSERATYLVALHYTRDGSEETVIRTVVATPR